MNSTSAVDDVWTTASVLTLSALLLVVLVLAVGYLGYSVYAEWRDRE